MNISKKALATAAIIAASAVALVGCSRDSDVASRNLSHDADNFKIERRVVFFNGITDQYLLEIRGLCSIADIPGDQQLEVTCKVGDGEYKKHLLGLSDNVSYFVEQIDGADVSAYNYKVTFKPEAIVPDIELRTSAGDS